MSTMGDVKLKIKEKLEELVTDQVLKEVVLLSPKTNSFNLNNSFFPVAVLASPSCDSSRLDSNDNERVLTFDVLILDKKDNAESETYVEDMIEKILDKFDAPGVLGNLAIAVEPTYTGSEPIENGDGNVIAFPIVLKVRTNKQLI